ncbi:Oxygen tolerance [Dysgonomonas macrotermitis]|uniref:Oxygen tolerance n=2 Tax=Dysgonomonas macrotermitis TaxID=1346286 RepID=A0A1M5HRN7_9BACT|nr:Oxygen tolerance [Dysgonomonas macrotermitis]
MYAMQKYLVLFILSLLSLSISSQDVSFRASAPNAVAKGDNFRLMYTLRGGEGSNITIPETIKGFDILYGPAVSSSYSTQIINGKATTDSSESYIYTLTASEEGTFTVPAATIKVNGKTYTSNTVQVKVLPPDKNAQNNQQGGNRSGAQASESTSTAQKINPSDAFIRAIVSKTKVYEQEAFVVTFRFYTTLQVSELGKIEFPEFEGFMVEDQDLPPTRQLTMEHYNGRNYYSVDLRRTLLFPQRSGKITIPSGKIEMVFNVRSGKAVQTFFGPQYVMTDVKKVMTTTPLTINVTPLPETKPANFSNGVGTFTMTPSITSTNIKANDAVTLKLVISGTGNMKLIKTPELQLPKDFETYDPKITNDLKYTDKGLTGSKTIEYLFIPRYQGTYKIPPVQLVYFDNNSNSYKTLSTPEYTLNVAKDPNAGQNSATSFNNQSEVKVEQDIRYLKTGTPSLSKVDTFLFGSVVYYLWYTIPFILFVVFFILYRKQIKENADVIRMKTKQANKVAVKRLKLAGKYLQSHQKEPFYEEVLRATWGYLSDKLVIPVADLNRDNIEQELTRFGASEDLIDKFISILDTCEFARYAPAESDTAMDDLYKDTVDAIGEMENLKVKK